MSFYAKYEILALLRDDAAATGIKTFSARHLAWGRRSASISFSKMFPANPLPFWIGCEAWDRSRCPGNRGGPHEGTSYVVTAPSSWPQSFDEWLGRPAFGRPTKASADNYTQPGNWRVPTSEFIRKSDPGATPASAATPIPEPGGFTRMFSISPRSAGGGEMSTSSAMHPSAIRPVPTQAPFTADGHATGSGATATTTCGSSSFSTAGP